ncbi:MAG: hypothetical protein QM323_03900 [Acidobacteriota bacterium]|nr:hypothetical protein [Acidobacteriota bacterium]
MGRPITSSSPGARARRHRGARLMLVTSIALLLTLLFAAGAEAAKSGKLLYAKRIGGSATEAGAWAVAAGPKGVTALAGGQEKGGDLYPMVAKYTGAGKRVWLKRYTAAGTGHFADVAFDRSGNVYVAATVDSGTSPDIVVLKYSAAGVLRWATPPYDSGSNGADEAVKLAVDGKGDVVVLGESNYTGRTGIVVLKYTKNGKLAWAEPTRWDPDPAFPDQGDHDMADLALDGKGDIYVAGSVKFAGIQGGLIRKARGSDGAKLKGWVHEPRHGDSSFFEALAVRGSSVVATGLAWTEGVDHSRNALIVKFDRGLREKAWKEWGVGNKSEEWFREAVIDGKGSVFVTGIQWLEDKYAKVVTMKLNAKLKTVWSKTYMPASKYAIGLHIARDGAGNVYVGGVKNPDRPKQAVLTIKYSAAGARKWVKTWSGGSGGSADYPTGLVLGSKDGVYVGGFGTNKAGVHQAVLLKYRR